MNKVITFFSTSDLSVFYYQYRTNQRYFTFIVNRDEFKNRTTYDLQFFISHKAQYNKSFFVAAGSPDNLRNIINEPWHSEMEQFSGTIGGLS